MNTRRRFVPLLPLSFATFASLAACASPQAAPPAPAIAPAALAKTPVARVVTREQIAEWAIACAAQSPFFGKGVGGSPLRGAAAAQVEAQKTDGNLWFVHLPETTVASLPTGLDLYVNGRDGTCSMAPMD